MKTLVNSYALASRIIEQYQNELYKETEIRLRIIDLAQKFNNIGSVEEIVERAEKLAKFVFSHEKAAECLKAAVKDEFSEQFCPDKEAFPS